MAKNSEKKSSVFNLAEILHIKTHTVSTSNELSLSVLDALSKQANEKQAPPDAATKIGRVSLFTLNTNKTYVPTSKRSSRTGKNQNESGRSGADVAGYALDLSPVAASAAAQKRAAELPNPEAEINRRKARRRMRRMVGTALACCCALVVVGCGALYLTKEYNNHQDLLGDLSKSVALVSDSDEVVVALDELISEPLNDETIKSAEELYELIGETEAEVAAASDLSHKVTLKMRDSSDKEAAHQTYLAAEARKIMLSSGHDIIAANIDYYYACQAMTQMWGTIHQADILTQEAAALVADTTTANTQASQEKTEAALSLFNKARDQVDDIAGFMSSADLTPFANYLDMRIEAMGHALASDEAIYIQDKSTAEFENDLYNKAENGAAEIAADFPEDPLELLETAHEDEISSLMSEYEKAREDATNTDAFLRDYLGTEK